ncbi:sigma factor-like helix-turn-helix DNA-binding protein [Kaarinaea lacus]
MEDYKDTIISNIPYLRRYARVLTNNTRLADRMVQQCIDCAMDLHQLIKKEQDGVVRQKIWLFSIFHNIYNEFIAEQQTIVARLPNSYFSENEEFTNTYENDQYYRAFMQLPLQQKQIFLLVSVEKFLYEEVSKIVNLPLGAILSLLHTARHSIAEQIYSVHKASLDVDSEVVDTGLSDTNHNKSVVNNDQTLELSL